MKIKRKLYVVVGVMLIAAILCGAAFLCRHKEVYNTVVVEPTCTEEGREDVICVRCETLVESLSIPANGHDFGEFEITREPGVGQNGEKIRACNTCGKRDIQEFECPHEVTRLIEVRKPTCGEVGLEDVICEKCETIVEVREIETLPHPKSAIYTSQLSKSTCSEHGIKATICAQCETIVEEEKLELLECNYGEWEYVKRATPFESGERYRHCTECGKRDGGVYTKEMGEDSIYIPSAGIDKYFSVNWFTQSAVNCNDIVYTEYAYAEQDPSNPFILGHWYGELGKLHKTKIGDKIYVRVNGAIDVYEVVVSEYALLEEAYNRINIIGQETGVNVWDSYGSAVNYRNITAQWLEHAGVDRWPDVNDGKTLHMYTCYYDRGEPWEESHGTRGRWIVIANLVDTIPVGTPEDVAA